MQGLVINAGGAGGRMIFFTHPLVPDRTIHTGNHSILNDINLMSHFGIAREIRQMQEEKKRSEIRVIVFALFCLACFYGVFQLKESLVTAIAKARACDMGTENRRSYAFSVESRETFYRRPGNSGYVQTTHRPPFKSDS